jgi:beta-galactosidase
MYIGVDYYPEHWPQDRWETDARLMREAGLNVVRMAEFAWVDFEPQEGQFDFAWLDKALNILARNGISAILGTPTAAMPAWVAHKYPEVMAMETTGRRCTWGVRKNNCFSSQTYRRLSRAIVRAMAEHFAATPNVIGWQTDNEFGGPTCFCDSCREAFQSWLKGRYADLDALNRAWGTHFWGQKYGSWQEIQTPTDHGTYHPSLLLDWKRFNSWQNVTFQAEQVRILREICPQHFVTHNLMGLCQELNYYDLARDLDFVSWDNYPVGGSQPDVPVYASAAADLMRGMKGKNFWIMETTAGAAGWGIMGRNPRPGEIRKVALQQTAHGCDNLLWFRWRTCTAGREQYWHGLLGHDGVPRRRYHEAAQTAAEMRKLEAELSGTTVRAEVALIFDYESSWAFSFQPAYPPKPTEWSGWWGQNYTHAIARYYAALFRAGVNVDMIPPTADFSPYKVVIAPHLYILPDQIANRLKEFVARGGVLLTDCRTAVKDEGGLCYDRPLPGLLAEPLGIRIDEYESLPEIGGYPFIGKATIEGSYTAERFVDWVTLEGAEALAEFQPWHMRAFAPLSRNRYGLGWGYYAGVIVKEETFYDKLLSDVLNKAGISSLVHPPCGVEVSLREGEGKRLLFLINHLDSPQKIRVPAGKLDLLRGTRSSGSLTLEPYGIAVLKL